MRARKVHMSTRPDPDPIKSALHRAEAEVARHLDEACEDADPKALSEDSLDELLRLEDELLAAARAVEDTLRHRRRLDERGESSPRSRESTGPAPAPAPEEAPGCRLRDFRDAEGREWRVWEVKPGSTGRPTNPERYLGEYVKGWLAFESTQTEIRMRLPNHPLDWFRMADADLGRFLPQAVEVQKRKPKAGPRPEAP
jgi:hypothetical protein